MSPKPVHCASIAAVITEFHVATSTFPVTADTIGVRIVAAIGRRGELGRDNRLLFRLKADMANSRRISATTPLVVGRKNWETPPNRQPTRSLPSPALRNSTTRDSGPLYRHPYDAGLKH